MSASKFTLLNFLYRYPNDDVCLDELWGRRCGHLEHCPDCAASTKWSRVKGRTCFQSQWCGFQVYPFAGSIFEKTRTPLRLWFFAIYLFSVCKNGVSGKELQRHLGVTSKTAWRIGQQIRTLMDENGEIVLEGKVEMDESHFGGRHKGGKHGWGSENKTCVFGMASRDGKVVTDRKASTLIPIILGSTPQKTFTLIQTSFQAIATYIVKYQHTKQFVTASQNG